MYSFVFDKKTIPVIRKKKFTPPVGRNELGKWEIKTIIIPKPLKANELIEYSNLNCTDDWHESH